jgi:hypothetical protein
MEKSKPPMLRRASSMLIRKKAEVTVAPKEKEVRTIKFILGILLAIQKGDIPRISTNNEYRSVLNFMKEEGLIEINLSCDEIHTLIKNKKPIEGETGSPSRQWININEQKFFKNIKPNNEKLKKIIKKIAINESNKCKLNKALKDMINDVIKISKEQIFAKISGMSDDDNSYFLDVMTEREIKFYNFLSNYVFKQNLPHVATLMYNKICDIKKASSLNISFDDPTMNGKIKFNEYLRKRIGFDVNFYNILLTERMENSNNLKDFLSNVNNVGNTEKVFVEVLFQIIYTLLIFGQLNFIQNDLHMGNIFIETLKDPTDFYYVIKIDDVEKVVHLKSKYLVRIFDFDRSYQMGKTNIDEQAKENKYKNLKGYTGLKDIDDKKRDLFYMCRWIEYIENKTNKFTYVNTYINKILYGDDNESKNKYPGEKVPLELAKMHNDASKTMEVSDLMKMFIIDNKLIKSDNIIIYDKLEDIKITDKTEIFIDIKANIKDLQNKIKKNESWIAQPLYKKIIINSNLVTDEEYNQNTKKFIESYTKKKDDIDCQFGGSTKKIDYYDKYQKYKKKYLDAQRSTK